jgi:hypothetical protein
VVCVLAFTEDFASHYFAQLRQWKAEKIPRLTLSVAFKETGSFLYSTGLNLHFINVRKNPSARARRGLREFLLLAAPVAATII